MKLLLADNILRLPWNYLQQFGKIIQRGSATKSSPPSPNRKEGLRRILRRKLKRRDVIYPNQRAVLEKYVNPALKCMVIIPL